MTAFRYIGDGSYLVGVPARDLSSEEAKRFQDVLNSPHGKLLYEEVAKSKSRKAGNKAAAESED